MILFTSFFSRFLSLIFAALTLIAGLVESRIFFHYFFFLSFLALLKGLESWVELGIEILEALDLSL